MEEKLNTDHFHDAVEKEEEAEETLSLCDLPLDGNYEQTTSLKTRRLASSSSSTQPHDQFFEFFSDLSSDMCPADDIIFCGRLVPFKEQRSRFPKSPSQTLVRDIMKQNTLRRRSESLSEIESYATRMNSTKIHKPLRTSRSLDYQKLRRFANSKTSPESDIDGNSSIRSLKSDKKSSVKNKWYFPVFGMLKFPPEMDLRDIKSRQFRRSSSVVMFPSLDTGGNLPVNRNCGKGGSSSSSSWRFIKALSCKDHASVAVTASLCV